MFLFASFNVKITIKVRMVDFKLKTPKDKYNHPTPSKHTKFSSPDNKTRNYG